MTDFKPGVVITVAQGRRENVDLVLQYLIHQEFQPTRVILVYDGPEVERVTIPEAPFPINGLFMARKHAPGMEQPRNMGVRALDRECTHAWFLDSDIITTPSALRHYAERANGLAERAILIGPYEWLQGAREPDYEMHNDPRWAMFNAESDAPRVGKLNVALGCFGGNLVWPIPEFKMIGGFHPQLHHGRCEDGELGLRAASHQIPMQLVPEARGWHLQHPVNHELAAQRNARDVPLLNSWHPWVEEKGLVISDQDGARFDFICDCGEQVNTLLMWDHMARCKGAATCFTDEYVENNHSLILPEGM